MFDLGDRSHARAVGHADSPATAFPPKGTAAIGSCGPDL